MTALPDGFTGLEPFVAEWAVETAFARDARRGAKSEEDRQAFYDAFHPLLASVLDRLDQTPLARHDPAEHSLMLMALSFANVAKSTEVHGRDEAKHARSRLRLPITRATADL